MGIRSRSGHFLGVHRRGIRRILGALLGAAGRRGLGSMQSRSDTAYRRDRDTTWTGMIAAQDCGERWQMFYRLQELGIACHCAYREPLWLSGESLNALAVAQVWSVCRHCRCDCAALRTWLEMCWQQPDADR